MEVLGVVTVISSAPGEGVESIMSAEGDSDDMMMYFSTQPYVLLFPQTLNRFLWIRMRQEVVRKRAANVTAQEACRRLDQGSLNAGPGSCVKSTRKAGSLEARR
jgi:hypothetical protein